MDMNDPLRREEKTNPSPERQEPGPSQPDQSRPGRDGLLKRVITSYSIHYTKLYE